MWFSEAFTGFCWFIRHVYRTFRKLWQIRENGATWSDSGGISELMILVHEYLHVHRNCQFRSQALDSLRVEVDWQPTWVMSDWNMACSLSQQVDYPESQVPRYSHHVPNQGPVIPLSDLAIRWRWWLVKLSISTSCLEGCQPLFHHGRIGVTKLVGGTEFCVRLMGVHSSRFLQRWSRKMDLVIFVRCWP